MNLRAIATRPGRRRVALGAAALVAGLGVVVASGAATGAASSTGPEAISPAGFEWTADYGMSPAVRVGDLLFLSGQVAEVDGDPADPEALRAAYRGMFASAEAVLSEAGASWDGVVDVTSFHTDVEAQGELFMEVRGEFVGDGPFPTWTAVDADRLYTDDIATEIKLVAYVGE